ncbi:glycosyltransferase family 2 protein [Actinophytocola gossypii]|uniref:Glycosyltransferase family 2 protein n=1 Tax=Actinophytocola gossypii TaxID=2812003 RepID=A0ABT2JFD9_9PSEU|nr:glycosyltransferase family 2 protein [Actinophytocola gossypii]MCT2586590.1 glycosyltransferase family 2 protein [Actinophytocola gossypii]
MSIEAIPEVRVSVLIPVKDEEATLRILLGEIDAAFATMPETEYEVIFVDDGSTDRSWPVMCELARDSERVRALRLRRNFGKAAALAAAVDEARGELVVTMDADLQDDPAEVPRLLAELEDGADLVSGHKADRKDPLGKRIPSKFFNKMTGVITGLKLNDHNCGLKAARTEVYRRVPLYGELHRYIPALAHQSGYKVRELAVNHRPREHGRSKYGFERYVRGAIDLLTVMTITKYGRRPAHLFGGLGLASGLLGFVLLAYLTVVKLFGGEAIGDRPLLMLGILLVILGVQMISIGLIAEIVLHRTANRREATELIAERTKTLEPADVAEPAKPLGAK